MFATSYARPSSRGRAIRGARAKKRNGRLQRGRFELLERRTLLSADAVFELSSLLPENGGDGSAGFVLNGVDAGDSLGYATLNDAGDVNGDGYDDVIIGAPLADPNGTSSGECYVVFGGASIAAELELSSLNGSNGFIINGIDPYDDAGYSVGAAGDVNGDGYDDVIIGAVWGDPNGMTNAGEVYVLFGAPSFSATLELSTLNGTNGFVMNGISPDDRVGYHVSSAGDFNGDGYDDVVFGAYRGDPNGVSNAGESYVVFGAASFSASLNLSALDGSNGFILNGIDPNDYSGIDTSVAGDVNGDGYDDVIIGAHYADPNGVTEAGESYVVFGAPSYAASLDLSTLDGANGFVINGVEDLGHVGWPVSGAGDFNGDGYDDVIVRDLGHTYVILGTANFSASLDLSALDGTNSIIINATVVTDTSRAGDINGDGYDDILIGKNLADPNGITDAGESYVVFGGANLATSLDLATLDGTNGFVLKGIDPGDFSGNWVSGGGDVNGDGYDDVIIGASKADPNGMVDAGESYVVFGFARSVVLTADAGGPYTVVRGGWVQLDAGDSRDPDQNTATLVYSWDLDGDGQFDDAVGIDPVYSAAGIDEPTSITVEVLVTNDLGETSTDTATIAVEDFALLDDPLGCGDTMLAIGGTSVDDHIVFNPAGSGNGVTVIHNGVTLGTFEPTSRLVAYGQDGNDTITVSPNLNIPAWLYGDAGNDRLKGGAGHDVLLGGTGDDLLVGGSGRDLSIGGTGSDRIVGNADDDLLIAGWLAFADQDEAICAIRREWVSGRDYQTRIENLTSADIGTSDRLNDNYFLLLGETVLDDNEGDVLTGSAGQDWFFFDETLDRATDLGDEVFANDLDWILAS